MHLFPPRFSVVLVIAAVFGGALGCGSKDEGALNFGDQDDDAGSQGDSGGSNDTGDAGAGGQGGGGGGCTTAADCDDGIPCTIDSCAFGACRHAAGGMGSCPSGQHCDVAQGCVAGLICSTDAQCEALAGDPCKTNIHCDSSSATCQFSILDNDGDGHPPLVCGGGDCNDADPSIFPGQVESCNGRDDSCNDQVDEDAICPGGGVCQAGQCACPPQNICNGVCVDFKSDAMNCGGCGIRCGANEQCKAGICTLDTTCKSPALFLMQDISGSMASGRFEYCMAGIDEFVSAPASSGLRVGIGYFPVPTSGSSPSSCQTDADCGSYGPCFFNMCFGGTGGSADSCEAADYAKPAVAIGTLPGQANAIKSSLTAVSIIGGSPLATPLQGAIQYARTYAQANSNTKAAVVFITDNMPNICSPGDTLAAAIQAAQTGASGNPPVKTFVIKLEGADGTEQEWNQLAQAGGTSGAYPVGSAANMQAALTAIRNAFSTCP